MSMTRAAALEQAIANLCAGPAADYARGEIDRAEFDKRVRNRRPEIERFVAELLRAPPPPELCRCGTKAVVVIDGRHYCAPCGSTATRLPQPVFVR